MYDNINKDMYDNINKLLLLSMLDIDWYIKHKKMPDPYFTNKYNDPDYQAMLPDLSWYMYPYLDPQKLIVDQKQFCNDNFILQQEEILWLKNKLYSPGKNDWQGLWDIIKSINVKYFQLLQSIEKVLQPFKICKYHPNSEEEYDFHLTSILKVAIYDLDRDQPYLYLWSDRNLQQVVLWNLNTFYREAFSILECLDILHDVENWTITTSEIEKLDQDSKLRSYWYASRKVNGRREMRFNSIEWKYSEIDTILSKITRFIAGTQYDFKQIRNVITHRLDYQTVFDIDQIYYSNRFVDILNYLLNIKKDIPKYASDNYHQLMKDYPEFENKLEEFEWLQYIDWMIDDITNIYIYLFQIKKLFNRFNTKSTLLL